MPPPEELEEELLDDEELLEDEELDEELLELDEELLELDDDELLLEDDEPSAAVPPQATSVATKVSRQT